MAKKGAKGQLMVFVSVSVNLGVLAFYKYLPELMGENVSGKETYWNLALPIGLSYFIFQILSYTFDVLAKRAKAPTLKSWPVYLIYCFFFPQFLVGPIERSYLFLPQIQKWMDLTQKRAQLFRDFLQKDFGVGLFLFLRGLLKKTLIAEHFAIISDKVFLNLDDQNGLSLLIGAIFYSYQLYFDFSGYTDMARGIGHFFGIKLSENFKTPFFSRDMSEFWRRFHMTLNTWFRDYIYLPLCRKRPTPFFLYFNLVLIFLLSGLWHDGTVPFLIWGALHALYLLFGGLTKKLRIKLLAKIGLLKMTSLNAFLDILLVNCLYIFSMIFFKITDMEQMSFIAKEVGGLLDFTEGPALIWDELANLLSPKILLCVLIGFVIEILAETGVLDEKTFSKGLERSLPKILALGILLAITYGLGDFDAPKYLYQRF